MGITEDIDDLRARLQLNSTSPNYVEVAATMMPRRMTGIKHTLRPACKFLPVPMSLGWQDNPIDDDYPQRKLVPGLQLTDIKSGAKRPVAAPWMHALYAMTSEALPSGVTRVEVMQAQFSQSFDWQHLAVICVLLAQVGLGCWGFQRNEFRESAFIFFGVFLQVLEGIYAWVFPSHEDPRPVKKARVYALHKGMNTRHILVISHGAQKPKNDDDKPYINLEDAAAPLTVTRKPALRMLEATFRKSLQLCNIGLRLACVLSQSNGLLIPLTLLIGTAASELLMAIRVPLPKLKSKILLPSETHPQTAPGREPNLPDMIRVVCQDTGVRSVGFVETLLPDSDGKHVLFESIGEMLDGGVVNGEVHPTHVVVEVLHNQAVGPTVRSRRNV